MDKNITDLILVQIDNYKLAYKIFTLFLDDASNNNIVIEHINNSLPLTCIGANTFFFNIRYICQFLNLIVQSIFFDIRDKIEK